MKLFIYDTGDMSAGLYPCRWEIECPFEAENVTDDELQGFKHAQEKLYVDYCNGQMTAYYETENI